MSSVFRVVRTKYALLFLPLSTGYSCFHISESDGVSMELISTPTSPFSRGLHSIGLWNPHCPWAHSAFRNTFKLFFWYTAWATLPTMCALYSGYAVLHIPVLH